MKEELRVLRKIANAMRIAKDLRKKGDDTTAECIESLVREIERRM